MPFSSKKKAGTAREADSEAIPISTPRYFLTLHIDPGAPGPQFSLFHQIVWAPGAPGTSHRILLTRITFRAQIDGVTETPSIAQMKPQTRHYIERGQIFVNFKYLIKGYDDSMIICHVSSWISIGAELFSRERFIPGASSRRNLIRIRNRIIVQLHYSDFEVHYYALGPSIPLRLWGVMSSKYLYRIQ